MDARKNAAVPGAGHPANGSAANGAGGGPAVARPRTVLIATPAHDHKCVVHYALALAETIRLCERMGIAAEATFWPGESKIQHARNLLISIALKGNFDDLVFIDGDQGVWPAAAVPRLLSHPVDCVGFPVRDKTDAEENYNVKADNADIPIDPKTGLMQPTGLGTGFLRLSRRAMLALAKNAEKYTDDFGNEAAWIFDIRPVKGRLKSEDFLLADKLRKAGIKVHLDQSFTCSHLGIKQYQGGDFLNWLGRVREAKAKQAAAQGAPR